MLPLMITGGCGFIGSHFIRYLFEIDPDISILNVDALTYAGKMDNLRDAANNSRYQFVQADIADREKIRPIVSQGIAGIINFAAESHVDRSIFDSRPFVHTNVMGTQVLLDLAREYQVPRFLQISTDEVYGSLGSVGLFTEESPLAPNSPYAASKAAGDFLVRAFQQTFGLPALITRCSNNYGPYQFPEKIIPLFITNLLQNKQVPLFGDGQNVRDWIHVRDHCAGIWMAWKKGRPGEIYNFGGNCELSNLTLTQTLLRLLNKPASLIQHVEDRLGHDRRYAVDSSKAKKELGWKPTIPFEEGLRETIHWYENWASPSQRAMRKGLS